MFGKIKVVWLAVAALLLAAALDLYALAASGEQLYFRPEGDPQETVTRFFDSLKAGDYPAAYACLGDYATLGLENEAGNGESALVFAALKDSYDAALTGACAVEQRTAKQSVRFRYLDVPQLEAAAAERVEGALEEIIGEQPGSEFFDGEGRLLTEVTDAAYAAALSRTLAEAERYYATAELVIELDYTNGQWLMRTAPALLSALRGGVA